MSIVFRGINSSLVEPSIKLDGVVSRAVSGFADEKGWEHHIRYNDAPIWLLRKGTMYGHVHIQLAFFASSGSQSPEGYDLYAIPHRSDLTGEDLNRFRISGQRVISYEKAHEDAEVKKMLDEVATYLILT